MSLFRIDSWENIKEEGSIKNSSVAVTSAYFRCTGFLSRALLFIWPRYYYEEARTTKITRDTVLAFAYDYSSFEVIYVEKGVLLGFKTFSVQNLPCIRQRYAIDV